MATIWYHQPVKGYDLTEEGFRQKFRQTRIQLGEMYAQFGVRLDHYLNTWLELSDVGKDFVKLKSFLIREQILSGCGPELTVHLEKGNHKPRKSCPKRLRYIAKRDPMSNHRGRG